jgi:hypothetical protein
MSKDRSGKIPKKKKRVACILQRNLIELFTAWFTQIYTDRSRSIYYVRAGHTRFCEYFTKVSPQYTVHLFSTNGRHHRIGMPLVGRGVYSWIPKEARLLSVFQNFLSIRKMLNVQYRTGESIQASKTAPLCLSTGMPSIWCCLVQTNMTLLLHIALKSLKVCPFSVELIRYNIKKHSSTQHLPYPAQRRTESVLAVYLCNSQMVSGKSPAL